MSATYRQQLTLSLQGVELSAANIDQKADEVLNMFADEKQRQFAAQILDFLQQWYSPSETIEVKTSGSTGTPKILNVNKLDMMQSAENTCRFFDLNRGDTALICLPIQFIAGKMMVVRALVASLNLIVGSPSLLPFEQLPCDIRFAALTPMQLENILNHEEARLNLAKIEQMILGGSGISSTLQEKIKLLLPAIYSTYGMTETLSHIALQRLNGDKAERCYTVLPAYSVHSSAENTLNIELPWSSDIICTNDIVEMLSAESFRYVGRKDTVINSGGLKFSPETIEQAVAKFLDVPFAISSVADSVLGEKIVLVSDTDFDFALFLDTAKATLDHKMLPKTHLILDQMPHTDNGKIDRRKLKEVVAGL